MNETGNKIISGKHMLLVLHKKKELKCKTKDQYHIISQHALRYFNWKLNDIPLFNCIKRIQRAQNVD